jgi:hypothetical protein
MLRRLLQIAGLMLFSGVFCGAQRAQEEPSPTSKPAVFVQEKTPALQLNSAENLYLKLRSVGLDKSRVFQARNVLIDKAAFHLTLEDGTIAFTEDVEGRVTGAFFEGEGEVLLSPPNQVERASMALFSKGAILEERFVTAYLRFNDETFAELRPALGRAEDPQAFVSRWNQTAVNLAESDALRLLTTFSKFLPDSETSGLKTAPANGVANNDDRYLHVRLQGERLGVFDLRFDSASAEQILAGQLRVVDGISYYDVWTSFSLAAPGSGGEAVDSVGEGGKADAIAVTHFKIRAEIKPPTQIDAEARLQLEVRQGGQRAVLFELSRALRVKSVEADGHEVEFIHNPTIEGTQLAKRGNDLVAVVFPQSLKTGQKVELRFVYGGDVLSEAGEGLLYVGDRGTWYPNRGLVMSNFDLEFHYPPEWTLIATGKKTETPASNVSESEPGGAPPSGEQVSRWVSERPIPIAGFDLGKFERVAARAGDVTVEAYATPGVERGFPRSRADDPAPSVPHPGEPTAPPPMVIAPSPARNALAVANASARAIDFYAKRFGPYPYFDLKLAQLPGQVSQGWPGLVFLSSFSFLTGEEKSALHLNAVDRILISQVIGHETAHQWWGDLVMWSGYRDQWIVEALANYSSLMVLEAQNPIQFHAALERYRDDLLQKNSAGVQLMEDGPVTLGTRLSCSHFPTGYEAISYGRGTWLFHMLRNMLRDAERGSQGSKTGTTDEPFVRVLRRIRERYEGKPITTRELLQAFEEELPRSIWYERRKSLDWFYQSWVNGTAVPRFELRGLKYADRPGATAVSGVILQKDAPDNLVTLVPLYASVAGKMVLISQVFADGPETHFQVSASPGARRVVVDPELTLLSRAR